MCDRDHSHATDVSDHGSKVCGASASSGDFERLQGKGFPYVTFAQNGDRGSKIPAICRQTVHNFLERGGGGRKVSVDVIWGAPHAEAASANKMLAIARPSRSLVSRIRNKSPSKVGGKDVTIGSKSGTRIHLAKFRKSMIMNEEVLLS